MFRMTQQFVTFPPSAVTTMPIENPPDHSQVLLRIFLLVLFWISIKRNVLPKLVSPFCEHSGSLFHSLGMERKIHVEWKKTGLVFGITSHRMFVREASSVYFRNNRRFTSQWRCIRVRTRIQWYRMETHSHLWTQFRNTKSSDSTRLSLLFLMRTLLSLNMFLIKRIL